MAAPAWVPAVLQALHVRTREELDVLLRRGASADKRIFEAAKAQGWEVEMAPYPERGWLVYSPGALRRWTLSLPVYRSDKKPDHDYDAVGIRFRGELDRDPAREAFLRQQLKDFFKGGGGQGGARPALQASASIVMAEDNGAWWPARLGTAAEAEWYRREFGFGAAAAGKKKGKGGGGVVVNLLCFDQNSGLNTYDVAQRVVRVTPAELKELYEFSQAEHNMHPDAACSAVTGTRHADRRTFKRRQRQEQFRAAVAFALAFHRLAPEAQRCMPLAAPVANDATVPHFTTQQFEDPCTPEVEGDPSLAFMLGSLRYGLQVIADYEDWERQANAGAVGAAEGEAAAAAGGEEEEGEEEEPAEPTEEGHEDEEQDRRVKPRLEPQPPSTSRQHQPKQPQQQPQRPRIVHALLLKQDDDEGDEEDEEEATDEEVIDAPGGGAHGNGGGGGSGDLLQQRAAGEAETEEDADARSHTTASIPSDDIPPALDDEEEDEEEEGKAASAASAAAAAAGGSAGAVSVHPAAALLAAFERVMALVDMKDRGKLERFRAAAAAYARGGPDFVAVATGATTSFNELWMAVSARLKQRRAAPQVSFQAVSQDVRARLQASGLGEHAATVLQARSVDPLRRRLGQILSRHGWNEASLEIQGRELVQARAAAAQAVTWFEKALRGAPAGTTAEWRAATEGNKVRFGERVREVEGLLQRHGEAMQLRRAVVEIRPLVYSLQHHVGGARAAALRENHEGRLFALWGSFVTAVSSSGVGAEAGTAAAGVGAS